MYDLEKFIEYRLKLAKENPKDAWTFFSQAFGALDFFCSVMGDDDYYTKEAARRWDEEWRPAFVEL